MLLATTWVCSFDTNPLIPNMTLEKQQVFKFIYTDFILSFGVSQVFCDTHFHFFDHGPHSCFCSEYCSSGESVAALCMSMKCFLHPPINAGHEAGQVDMPLILFLKSLEIWLRMEHSIPAFVVHTQLTLPLKVEATGGIFKIFYFGLIRIQK